MWEDQLANAPAADQPAEEPVSEDDPPAEGETN